MAKHVIVAHVGHDKTSLTAAITKVLAELEPMEHRDDEITVILDCPQEFEVLPPTFEDLTMPTKRELCAAGIRQRGTKRDDIPRPKDLYRQRTKGFRP